jgi:hypothetical protein
MYEATLDVTGEKKIEVQRNLLQVCGKKANWGI